MSTNHDKRTQMAIEKIPLSRIFNSKLFNILIIQQFRSRNLQEADSIESNASADHCAYVLGNFPYHPKAFNFKTTYIMRENITYFLRVPFQGKFWKLPEGKYNPHKIILDHITLQKKTNSTVPA